MKKDELMKIIEAVVRNEIKKQLPTLIRQQLLEGLSAQSAPKPQPKVVRSESVQPKPQPKPQNDFKKLFPKNPALAAILSETTGHGPSQATGPIAYTENSLIMESAGNVPLTTTTPSGESVDPSEIPDFVKTALTKDYTALLKAVDKKVPR
jgi:hypothetical protein